MKKVWKQILRAAGFFGIFFGAEISGYVILSVVLSFIVSFRLAAQSGGSFDITQYTNEVTALYTNNMTVGLLISLVLGIGILFIIFGARKVDPFQQVDAKKTPGVFYLLAIIGALGCFFFLEYVMYVIPFPESLMNSLNDSLLSTTASGPFLLSFLANVIAAPILEEVFFRGLIFGRLNRAMPTVVAMIITSLLFGLMHGHPVWIIWAFCFGMIINYIRVQSGSIIPGLIIHMILNAIGVVANNTNILSNLTMLHVILFIIIGALLLIAYFILCTIFGKKAKAEGKVAEPVLEEEEILYSRKKRPVDEVVL